LAEPSTSRIRQADLRIDRIEQPGWVLATERMPLSGETVQCTDGLAYFVRAVGRTDSGGRLLELSMLDGRRQPFFAAAANVLVTAEPPTSAPTPALPADTRRPRPATP
jgi:hypothetical protein